VIRRDDFRYSIVLALVKFAGDTARGYGSTGTLWAPTAYFRPVHALVSARVADALLSLLPMLESRGRAPVESSVNSLAPPKPTSVPGAVLESAPPSKPKRRAGMHYP